MTQLSPTYHDSSPAVSVLVPVRNGERYIAAMVRSLADQTMTDWELVVVLDASTDASEAILSGFRDPRIRIVTLTGGIGLVAALNAGLRLCRAPLVARLDADDVCKPYRLERQLEVFAARRHLGVLGSSAYLIDEQGRQVGVRHVVTGTTRVARRLLWCNSLIHPSITFRRSVVERAGGYDGRCQRAEDYHLWLRCLSLTEVDNLPEPLISYRLHSHQHSRGTLRSDAQPLAEARRSASQMIGVSTSGSAVRQAIWLSAQWRRELFRRPRRSLPQPGPRSIPPVPLTSEGLADEPR
jgi:glycosyltransferase involved in cell wall biosynthesis